MVVGESIYLGDGAYLTFNGYGFEFKANSHTEPTDTVHVEIRDTPNLIRVLTETLENLC